MQQCSACAGEGLPERVLATKTAILVYDRVITLGFDKVSADLIDEKQFSTVIKSVRSVFSVLVSLSLLLSINASTNSAQASHSVFGLEIAEAFEKDLFNFFHFRLVGLTVTRDGFTELVFRTPKTSPYRTFVKLFVTLDVDGKIRRMRMEIQRRFINDERQGMFARDIEKSFIQASVRDVDYENVDLLVNEIFFRQKLTKVEVGKVVSENKDGEKKESNPSAVFKLGGGKLMPGDIIIVGDAAKLPPLPPTPSQLYNCFIGQVPEAEIKLSDTILKLENIKNENEEVLSTTLIPAKDAKSLENLELDFSKMPMRLP